MSYRLILDENVEHDVLHRLDNYGHDVEHVDFIAELGKGAADRELATYSLEEDRVILSYDDDFVLELTPDQFRAVLYLPDASLSVDRVADVVDEISNHFPQEELDGVEYVGSEWL